MEQKQEQQPDKTNEQGAYPPPAEGRADIGEGRSGSQQAYSPSARETEDSSQSQ